MKKIIAAIILILSLIYSFYKEQINLAYVKLAVIVSPILVICYSFLWDLYGPVWPLLGYLLILGTIDIFTGFWASLVEKTITWPFISRRFWRGKAAVVTLFLLGLTSMLVMDKMLKSVHQEIPNLCYVFWLVFYGAYELISILENISRIGYLKGIPAIIKRVKNILPAEVKEAIEETKEEEKKN